MNWHVRPAEPGDAAGIASVVADAPWYPQDADHAPDAATPGIRTVLMALNPDATAVLVATDDIEEEIVGYATVHWHPYLMLGAWEGFVAELFVAAECRGQGIGAALLDRVRAEAMARGCVRLMLLNGRESEAYRRRFYTQRGWRERAELANFVCSLRTSSAPTDEQEEIGIP
jgi:GNAT superfamily N-acetyltransferase